MLILGIETSCDETSLALVEARNDRFRIRKNLVSSQIKIHKKYGGVVPEVAARAHVEKIAMMMKEINDNKKPDVIAVTAGPGLATALLVGVETARTLAYLWQKPLVAVNHLEGHIYANWLPQNNSEHAPQFRSGHNPQFPALCLIISGGHTELVLIKGHLKYKLIGQTCDDAIGECFDKVGKILGLPYPGGPEVAKAAEKGDPLSIKFPRPMIGLANFDFSFSGLKTAVLYYYKTLKQTNNKTIANICASFQQACIDVLIAKTITAAQKYQVKTILLGGGVAANRELQKQLRRTIATQLPEIDHRSPAPKYCGDNAAMIAAAGYFHAHKKQFTPWKKIKIDPNWELV